MLGRQYVAERQRSRDWKIQVFGSGGKVRFWGHGEGVEYVLFLGGGGGEGNEQQNPSFQSTLRCFLKLLTSLKQGLNLPDLIATVAFVKPL